MACAPLVDLSHGSTSEHEEYEEAQEYPLQGQAASIEQATPCAEDASQSGDDNDHSKHQHHNMKDKLPPRRMHL